MQQFFTGMSHAFAVCSPQKTLCSLYSGCMQKQLNPLNALLIFMTLP